MMLWGIRRNSAVGFFAQKFLAAFFQNPFFLPKGQNSRKSCNMRYNVFLLIRQDRLSRKAIRERRSNLFYRQLSKGHIFDCSPIFNRHIFLSRLHSDICRANNLSGIQYPKLFRFRTVTAEQLNVFPVQPPDIRFLPSGDSFTEQKLIPL